MQFRQSHTDGANILWARANATATHCAGATTPCVNPQLASVIINILQHIYIVQTLMFIASAVLHREKSCQQWGTLGGGHLADPRDGIASRLCIFTGICLACEPVQNVGATAHDQIAVEMIGWYSNWLLSITYHVCWPY